MFEGTTTGLQPVHIFLNAPAGHQWDWTAMIIAGAQIIAIGVGIWVMHRASRDRGQQIVQQSKQLEQQDRRLEQQAIDSERRHEEAMATLRALIDRMSPRPAEPSTG